VRLVIATTVEDPLAAPFWQAYAEAGGRPPASVFFIAPRRASGLARQAAEALLLFGPLDSLRSWRTGRKMRRALLTDPQRVFPGGGAFHYVSTLNRGEGFAALQQAPPDLLVSVGAPEIFKPPLLRLPAVGAVNVHNGRLPAYRGLFGSFWESFRGEEWGYTSLHVMAPQVDAGPVLAEAAVRLRGRPLRQVLLEKKREGGRLLASIVRFVEREGRLPDARPLAEETTGYYGWPTWRDLLVHRVMRGRHRPGPSPGPATSASRGTE